MSLPASIAQIDDGSLVGVAVVDEHGLFSMLVLKIAEVLIGTEVIDVRWWAGRGQVVIADLKERSVTPVGLAHDWPPSLSCRLAVGMPSATS